MSSLAALVICLFVYSFPPPYLWIRAFIHPVIASFTYWLFSVLAHHSSNHLTEESRAISLPVLPCASFAAAKIGGKFCRNNYFVAADLPSVLPAARCHSLLELLKRASCRKDWKRISAESSTPHVPPDDPIGQGTELKMSNLCLQLRRSDLRRRTFAAATVYVTEFWFFFLFCSKIELQ